MSVEYIHDLIIMAEEIPMQFRHTFRVASKPEEVRVSVQVPIRFLEVWGSDPMPAGSQALIQTNVIVQSDLPQTFDIVLWDKILNSEVATRHYKAAMKGTKLHNMFQIVLKSGDNPFQLQIVHNQKILSTATLTLKGL